MDNYDIYIEKYVCFKSVGAHSLSGSALCLSGRAHENGRGGATFCSRSLPFFVKGDYLAIALAP